MNESKRAYLKFILTEAVPIYLATYILVNVGIEVQGGTPSWLPIVSVACAALSTILDHRSTVLVLSQGGEETNPTVSPDGSNLRSKKRLIYDGGLVALSAVWPSFGLGKSLVSCAAAFGNMREYRKSLSH